MSQFFKSDQVQTDLNNIFQTYQEISNKTSQLATMNKQEKLDHIEDCKMLIDKQKTFYTRLSLAASSDSEAADMKTGSMPSLKHLGIEILLNAWKRWCRHLRKRHNRRLTVTK